MSLSKVTELAQHGTVEPQNPEDGKVCVWLLKHCSHAESRVEHICAAGFVPLFEGRYRGAAPVMNHKTDEYWESCFWRWRRTVRQDGDFVTSELLTSAAMDYFGEADRLATRWQNFEARLNRDTSRRP